MTKTYVIRAEDGCSERFEAEDLAAAEGMAMAWLSEAEFDTSGGTVWYHGRLYRIDTKPDPDPDDGDDDGDHECPRCGHVWSGDDGGELQVFEGNLTYTFDPPEPTCHGPGGMHAWQSPYSVVGGLRENPGVSGHGGGVIVREVCAHCGAYRITDTWAQDMSTGEQGLRSVAYEAPDDASMDWADTEGCDHSWVVSEEDGRTYCEYCLADGDA